MLRHTFASQMLMAGRSLQEVKELLGHTDLMTTLRYAHLAPSGRRFRKNLGSRWASTQELVPKG